MRVAIAVLLLVGLGLAQNPVKCDTVNKERDYLLDRVNQLEQQLKQAQDINAKLAAGQFLPITIGATTFETEDAFVAHYNEVVKTLPTIVPVGVPVSSPPIVVSPPQTFAPPLSCVSSTIGTDTVTNCY